MLFNSENSQRRSTYLDSARNLVHVLRFDNGLQVILENLSEIVLEL